MGKALDGITKQMFMGDHISVTHSNRQFLFPAILNVRNKIVILTALFEPESSYRPFYRPKKQNPCWTRVSSEIDAEREGFEPTTLSTLLSKL
jgi:predicted RNA-binding protein with PUA-like domain